MITREILPLDELHCKSGILQPLHVKEENLFHSYMQHPAIHECEFFVHISSFDWKVLIASLGTKTIGMYEVVILYFI